MLRLAQINSSLSPPKKQIFKQMNKSQLPSANKDLAVPGDKFCFLWKGHIERQLNLEGPWKKHSCILQTHQPHLRSKMEDASGTGHGV